MKKYTKYVSWIGSLILLLAPCICFALFNPYVDMFFDKMSFNPPNSDLSVYYLAKIFGAVPGASQLASAGRTILSPIFYVFNTGILGISGLFLGYTTFKVVTETTMDGSSMGKSATMWTAVRIGVSTSLLIPNTSGYSMINGIVMWVVIQSIGLADMTWNAAVDFIATGAPKTANIKGSNIDYSLIDPMVLVGDLDIDNYNKQFNSGSADVLRALVCSYTIRDAFNNKLKSNTGINYTSLSSNDFLIYHNTPFVKGEGSNGYQRGSGGYYDFPYVPSENTTGSNIVPFSGADTYNLIISVNKVPKITGICGRISYVTPPSNPIQADYEKYSEIYIPAKEAGLQNMITTLDSIAQTIVAQAKPQDAGSSIPQLDAGAYVVKKRSDNSNIGFSSVSGSYDNPAIYEGDKLLYKQYYKNSNEVAGPSSIDPKYIEGIKWPLGTQEILTAAATYQSTLNQAVLNAASKGTDDINEIYKKAKKRGWILAGSYYTILKEVENTVATANYDFYRLVGYKDNGATMLTNPEGNRSTPLACNPFFTTNGASAVVNLFKILEFGSADSQNSSLNLQYLNRALSWIYFTFPYAKVLGVSLYTPSVTLSVEKDEMVDRPDSFYYPSWSIGLIYAQLVLGAALMAIPPVAPVVAALSVVGVAIVTPVPLEFLYYDISQVMAVWHKQMRSTVDDREENVLQGSLVDSTHSNDPIVKLQRLGQQMIISSADYLFQLQFFTIATSTSYIISSAVMTFATMMTGLGSYWGITTGITIGMQGALQILASYQEITRQIINVFLPLGLAIVGPLFITGITLAVYVPLIPYLLFLFGVMSWFISVVVLMAAAPIICFLMLWGAASQENPLLSREAEQFVQQIISVFFRPTLMVIGLVVGVILARIGVDVLNAGFKTIIDNVFNSGLAQSNNPTVKMIQQLGTVVIYTFTMVSLVNLCFSTIHLLHSEVMGIIGIRVAAGGMEEKAMGEIKQGAQTFAEAGVSGAKEQATALKGLASSFKPTDGRTKAQVEEDDKMGVAKRQAPKQTTASGSNKPS